MEHEAIEHETIEPEGQEKIKKYSSQRRDSASWVYVHWIESDLTETGMKNYTCRFCQNVKYRHNVTRMRNHLINCVAVPDDVKEEAKLKCTEIAGRKALKGTLKNKSKKSEGLAEDRKRSSSEQEVSPSQLPSKKRPSALLLEEQSAESREDLDILFARALFSLGLKSDCLKDDKLTAFLKAMNPGFALPSEHHMRELLAMLELSGSSGGANEEL